jgi:methyl-accepting chemotaxis protein
MAIDWSNTITNSTSVLYAIFSNLSLAVNDNTTADYPSAFDNVTAGITAALGSGAGQLFAGISGVPYFAQSSYQSILNEYTIMFNNTGILINGSKIYESFLADFERNPRNMSLMAMPPQAVARFIARLTSLTNYYYSFVSDVTKRMNDSYNNFTYNDASLSKIRSKALSTIYDLESLGSIINATVINQTWTTFVAINASLAAFYSKVSPAVASSKEFTGNKSVIDDQMGRIANSLNNTIYNIIDSVMDKYVRNVSATIDGYFRGLAYYMPSPNRYMILQEFNTTGRSVCANNLTKNAESTLTALGGPTAFFNCSINEQVLLSQAKSVLNGTLTAIQLDFAAYGAQFNACNTLKTGVANGEYQRWLLMSKTN